MRHEHVHDSCVEAQKAKNTHGTLLWTPRRTLMPMIPHIPMPGGPFLEMGPFLASANSMSPCHRDHVLQSSYLSVSALMAQTSITVCDFIRSLQNMNAPSHRHCTVIQS